MYQPSHSKHLNHSSHLQNIHWSDIKWHQQKTMSKWQEVCSNLKVYWNLTWGKHAHPGIHLYWSDVAGWYSMAYGWYKIDFLYLRILLWQTALDIEVDSSLTIWIASIRSQLYVSHPCYWDLKGKNAVYVAREKETLKIIQKDKLPQVKQIYIHFADKVSKFRLKQAVQLN